MSIRGFIVSACAVLHLGLVLNWLVFCRSGSGCETAKGTGAELDIFRVVYLEVL